MRVPRKEVVTNPRKYGAAKEAALQSRGNYKPTINSGASGDKGDFTRGGFMVEHKATEADSYRVTAELIAKIRNDGLTNGKPGCLVVTLGNGIQIALLELRHLETLIDAHHLQDQGDL